VERQSNPSQGREKRVAIKLRRTKQWAWVKFKLKETSCSNVEEWKSEIIKLWVTRMSHCLKKLMDSTSRRLAEVIEKQGATTVF
jgi:formyltetrahydrofolate hydrolase